MQAMEFGRLAAEQGYLGLEWERFRKVARVLQRTPEVVDAGFDVLTDNPVQRGYGGSEIGALDIAFLVFAALLGGAINEDLGRRTWIAYSAPGQNFNYAIDTKTKAGRLRFMTEAQCQVTGHNRAGDLVCDILAFPDLAAQVSRLSLWREACQTHVLWRGDPPRMSTFAPEQPKTPPFWTEASMSGETLLAIAEATKGQHPVAWKRRDN
jgi:hypothetical protein